MSEYRAIYKCRLCGKNFDDGTVNKQQLASNGTVAIAVNGNADNAMKESALFRYSVHCCDDGSFGFSDFQGFKKVEK